MRCRLFALLTVIVVIAVAALAGCSDGQGKTSDSRPSSRPSPKGPTAKGTARLVLGRLPFEGAGKDAGGATPGEAVFTPASPNAPVRIQVLAGGDWHTATTGRQDSAGRVAFELTGPVGTSEKYRAVTSPADGAAAVTSPPTTTLSRNWHMVWHDEFDGHLLDPRNWRTRVQPPMGRRLCASPDPAMVHVRDGAVVLGIRRVGQPTTACPHGVFQNAMIGTGEVTSPGFSATHGFFAARVKFQKGRGQHGAFWLQGYGLDSAEIDTAEYYGDGRPDGGLSTLVHRTAADGTLTSIGGVRREVPKILGAGRTPATGWHVWSVDWSPKRYVFRLDNHVLMRTRKNLVSTPEFMVLSLLTSDWELPALNTTRSTMKVDWVRVWQQ